MSYYSSSSTPYYRSTATLPLPLDLPQSASSATPIASTAPSQMSFSNSQFQSSQPPTHHRRQLSEGVNAEEELAKAEETIFDLKLRLFYLEEKTKAGLPLPNQLYSSLMQNADLQGQLTSAEEELESKNALLVKARSAIESLTQEMQQLKVESQQERAQLQTDMNDRMHQAMHAMETQLITVRQQMQEANSKKLHQDDELQQLRLVLQEMERSNAHTVQENAQLAVEIRSMSVQIQEKEDALKQQQAMMEAKERAHESAVAQEKIKFESQLNAVADRTVLLDVHNQLQREMDSLTATHAALETQMNEWKVEIASREQSYKSTSEQLHTALQQLEDLKIVQSKYDESQAHVHQLELQLQSTVQEFEHTKQTHASLLASQQNKFEQMLSEDDRRLSESFQAERAAIMEAHQRHVETLSAEHATVVRAQEESNRTNFAELQDIYNRQLVELKNQHAESAAKLKTEFDTEYQREQMDCRTRINEITTSSEKELASKTALFDQQLHALETRLQDQQQRFLDEQEALHSAETKKYMEEIQQLKQQLSDAEHATAAAHESHKQTRILTEHQFANAEANAKKDAEQLAAIHALRDARAEEKLKEIAAIGARDLEELAAEHNRQIDILKREHASEASSQAAQHQREVDDNTALHLKEVANLRQQLNDSIEQARSISSEFATFAAAEKVKLDTELQTQKKDFQQQQESMLASIEQQWQQKEQELKSSSEKQLDAAKRETDHLRQVVIPTLRGQLEKLEAQVSTSYVSRSRFDEAVRRETTAREQVRELKLRCNELKSDFERVKSESVSVAKYQELEDEAEKHEKEASQMRHTLQRMQQDFNSSSNTTLQTPHSPILHVAMYPSTLPSASSTTFALPPASNRAPSPVGFQSFNSIAMAPLSANSSTTDHKSALRKLQSENRHLHFLVALQKRRSAEQELELEEDFVEKRVLQDAIEENETLEYKLKKRDTEVRQLRELLSVGSGSHSLPAAPIKVAQGQGVELSHLQDSSVASSTASPHSIDVSHVAADELLHEVTKLSRALKNRSAELAASQVKLREAKLALSSAQESMVDRGVLSDVESLLESAQRDLHSRDEQLQSQQQQMDQLQRQLQQLENAGQELRSTMTQQSADHATAIATLQAQCQKQIANIETVAETQLQQAKTQLHQLTIQADEQLHELESKHIQQQQEQSKATKEAITHLEQQHAVVLEQREADLKSRAAESQKHMEEQLSREVEHVAQAAAEFAARRVELETQLEKSEAQNRVNDEEKQRLELLIATLSQQMVELAHVVSLPADATEAIEQASFHPIVNEFARPPASQSRARPSHSPVRKNVSSQLFSPDNTAPFTSSRWYTDIQQFPLFTPNPIATSLNATASAVPAFISGSPLPSHSPLSLPMSPQAAHAASSIPPAKVTHSAALHALQPQLASLTSSMQSIYQSSLQSRETLREQAVEWETAKTKSEADKETLVKQHESAVAALNASLIASQQERATLTQQMESQQLQNNLRLLKEKEDHQQQMSALENKYEKELSKTQSQLQQVAHEMQLREQQFQHNINNLNKEIADFTMKLQTRDEELRQVEQTLSESRIAAATALEEQKQLLGAVRTELQAAIERSKELTADLQTATQRLQVLEADKLALEQKLVAVQTTLAAAPTHDAMQEVTQRLHASELECTRLASTISSQETRLKELEADKELHVRLQVEHARLEQSLEKMSQQVNDESNEKRDLLQQLDRYRQLEAEHADLHQRFASSDKRVQQLNADQQLNVQVTKRVLMEMCEILHASKIHDSHSGSGSAGSLAIQPPAFLFGGSFHYPDDAEACVKFIRSKLHELQRIRRAFTYTIHEVEEKWKGNFNKMQALVEQRGAEIAVLQRRLLTALGGSTTVTGKILLRH